MLWHLFDFVERLCCDFMNVLSRKYLPYDSFTFLKRANKVFSLRVNYEHIAYVDHYSEYERFSIVNWLNEMFSKFMVWYFLYIFLVLSHGYTPVFASSCLILDLCIVVYVFTVRVYIISGSGKGEIKRDAFERSSFFIRAVLCWANFAW